MNKHWYVILGALLWLLFSASTLMQAQTLAVSSRLDVATCGIPTARLMPVESINVIYQDREGYMWYGTDGAGLCRDNGYQVDVFRNDTVDKHLLDDNTVLHIAETGDGSEIWFSTREGLYALRKRDYTIDRIRISDLHVRVNDILCDSKGQMWVAFVDTLLCIDARSHEVLHRVRSVLDGSLREVMDIEEGSDGRIWAVQYHGVIVSVDADLSKAGDVAVEVKPGLDADIVAEKLYRDPSTGDMWLATWGQGLYVMHGNSWVCMNPRGMEATGLSMRIRNMFINRAHTLLWTSTVGGINVYSITKSGLQPLNMDGYSVSDYSFVPGELSHDMFDNVWVTSLDPPSHIISCSDKSIVHHGLTSNVEGRTYAGNVKSMVAEGDVLWVHKLHTHLVAYNMTTGEEYANPYFTSSSLVVRRGRGGVWAADMRGNVWGLFFDDGILRSMMGPVGVGQVDAMVDDGDRYLYFASEGMLQRHDYIERTAETLATGIAHVRAMQMDSRGGVYLLSSAHGLCRYDTAEGTTDYIVNDSSELTYMAIGPHDEVYVADRFGRVYSLEGDTLQIHPSACSSNSDPYSSMSFDKRGRLWLVANKYVNEYDVHERVCRKLSVHNPRVRMSSFYVSAPSDRGMIVGGVGGAVVIGNSDFSVTEHTHDASVAVSTYIVDGVAHCITQNADKSPKCIEVGASVSTLEFLLTTFDYLNTEVTQFQYFIEGLSRSWITMNPGENTIRMAGLSRGHYRLKVRVSEAGGPYSDAMTLVDFTRLPAWWESWWAITLYIIIAVVLVGVSVLTYLYMRHRRRQFNQMLLLLRMVMERQQQIGGGAVPRSLTYVSIEADATPDTTPDVNDADTVQMLEEEEISISPLDREFIDNAIKAVHANLDNTDYGVDQLADDVCMSRSNLYRRLLAVAGQTPTDFIKTIRLERAAYMLTTTTKSVAEIADLTGFSSASYFSKCFKNAYGILPKNYKVKVHT